MIPRPVNSGKSANPLNSALGSRSDRMVLGTINADCVASKNTLLAIVSAVMVVKLASICVVNSTPSQWTPVNTPEVHVNVLPLG
jgi:hypothetical protein